MLWHVEGDHKGERQAAEYLLRAIASDETRQADKRRGPETEAHPGRDRRRDRLLVQTREASELRVDLRQDDAVVDHRWQREQSEPREPFQHSSRTRRARRQSSVESC